MSLKRCEGFTLVEVMVAVLILAIGLLGLAHLHISSLKINNSAEFRSQASMLTADMFERMRANQSAAIDGDYNLALNAQAPTETDTLAQRDLSSWMQRVTGTANLPSVLPQGDASIACPAFVANAEFVCTITVSWREVQDDGSLGTTSFVFSGAL